jgi:hypothetical protein
MAIVFDISSIYRFLLGREWRRIGAECSDGKAGRMTRRPGPLKIETAELAGDIHHFADEI